MMSGRELYLPVSGGGGGNRGKGSYKSAGKRGFRGTVVSIGENSVCRLTAGSFRGRGEPGCQKGKAHGKKGVEAVVSSKKNFGWGRDCETQLNPCSSKSKKGESWGKTGSGGTGGLTRCRGRKMRVDLGKAGRGRPTRLREHGECTFP